MRYRIDIIKVTEGEKEIEVIFQMINLMVFQTKVKVTQLGPTLCNPMDFTVNGILQARIL